MLGFFSGDAQQGNDVAGQPPQNQLQSHDYGMQNDLHSHHRLLESHRDEVGEDLVVSPQPPPPSNVESLKQYCQYILAKKHSTPQDKFTPSSIQVICLFFLSLLT